MTEALPKHAQQETGIVPDYSVQRRIVGFFVRDDPNIFAQQDVDILDSENNQFMSRLRRNEYQRDSFDRLFESIPHPDFTRPEVFQRAQIKIDNTPQYADAVRRMADLYEKQSDETDLELVIDVFPNPLDFNSNAVALVQQENDEAGEENAQRLAYSLRSVAYILYGDGQKYLEQLALMQQEAALANNKAKSRMDRLKAAARIVVFATVGALTVEGALYTGNDILSDGHYDGPTSSGTQTRRTESEKEISVQNKYNIEILDIREAFAAEGKPFDIYNQQELGNHPPTRWTDEQISLLDDALSILPESFYQPNPDGTRLNFTITEFGKDCPCGGVFELPFMLSGRDPVIFLDDPAMIADNKQWVREAVAHELTHRKDIQLLGKSLWPKVDNILGGSFSAARDTFIPVINSFPDQPPSSQSVKDALKYGFLGIDNKGLDTPVEFIAVLGQLYVDGKEHFMEIGKYLGEDKAQQLYDLVKNELFEGKEYQPQDQNPQAEFLRNLAEQYGIDITDQIGTTTPQEVQLLAELLNSFPKSFYSEIEGKKLEVIIGQSFSSSADSVSIGINDLEFQVNTGNTTEQGYNIPLLTQYLIKRFNDVDKGERVAAIVDILGGGIIRNHPLKIYPKIFKPLFDTRADNLRKDIAQGELQEFDDLGLLTDLAQDYMYGREDFIKNVSNVVGVERAVNLYNEMRNIFGVEYTGIFFQGNPIPQTKTP